MNLITGIASSLSFSVALNVLSIYWVDFLSFGEALAVCSIVAGYVSLIPFFISRRPIPVLLVGLMAIVFVLTYIFTRLTLIGL